MPAIEVENVTKRFGDFCAVDGLSFNVANGEVFGLLGPNGAGKSTLIRILTTLLPPTSGRVSVNGHDLARAPDAIRRDIGVIPQALTSDLDLTADENLLIFAQLYGMSRSEARPVITGLLEAVDLLPWRDKPLKMYSGGMRRRLEIARGLVHRPRVFFLDEPTTGLDPVSRAAVWEMLNRLRREHGLTVLLTTHYMDEADQLCDRIAIVDHGRLVALDSPLKLKAAVPARSVIEASFPRLVPGWLETLRALPEVTEVKGEDTVFRLATRHGPATTGALLAAAEQAGIPVGSLSVASTTLDDVFVHYTGHQLRDALQAPAPYRSVVPGR
jgi:ABC-2 type transport system ATP-binding protein